VLGWSAADRESGLNRRPYGTAMALMRGFP